MEKNKEKASTYLQFFEFLRILNLGLRICDVIDWVGAKITTMTKNPYFGKCMSGSIATSFFFYVISCGEFFFHGLVPCCLICVVGSQENTDFLLLL